MERAMGIEPWSEAWEARNKNLKTLELGTLSRFAKPLIWKMKAMEGHLAWRATYVGAEPTGERGLVNSSGFTKLLHPVCPRALDRKSTRLNSSHRTISYAVFCLKKKKKNPRLYNQ